MDFFLFDFKFTNVDELRSQSVIVVIIT